MKDGTILPSEAQVIERALSERQALVLDELQLKCKDGCGGLYRRTLAAVKNRLIMDDDYEPSENLSLARALTMLERDLAVLSGLDEEDEAE